MRPLTDLWQEVLPEWRGVLEPATQTEAFRNLDAFLQSEKETFFPSAENIFRIYRELDYLQVRVVILGQDPYHGEDAGFPQANGLAFSVNSQQKLPPSLRNITRELKDDLGQELSSGDLSHWTREGVFLLNTVLTVRAHQAYSHRKRGWEVFTDAAIDALNQRKDPVVFVLWGKPAQQKASRIDSNRHHVILAPHPSPLSAHRGFFGSRPFSKINQSLVASGKSQIRWSH